jgi:FKBP-type peptidyl-prolyl cis-trans isomerase 2
VLENTMQAGPVSYLQGGSAILALLQQQIMGLQPGDKKTVHLNKAAGFTAEDFVFDIIIDEVRPASVEEILLGYPVQANAGTCHADCECYKSGSFG